ncbi:MAG: NYN domain-containing protein [Planctomycetota bacterium]|nr:MAG: NYN domain-containing protein [Planctomycetota bacterium]
MSDTDTLDPGAYEPPAPPTESAPGGAMHHEAPAATEEGLSGHNIHLDPNEDVEGLEREDLEERYLDLKDEVWRLRRALNLNPVNGELPNNGGYASPGGFLKRQRVAVFVDVQNMYHSAKKTYGRNLSYAKMLRACVRSRRLIRATAYVIEREGIDQVSFLDHLRYCGFEVRKREVIERMDGSRKAEWELGIATDMLRIADKVDVIIIVSGNGVFADVVPLLQTQGVKVECCAFRESMSDLLIRAVDHYHILSEEHLYK